MKEVFLKFLQNSQENTCARVSLLITVKDRLWHRCLPMNFVKFSRTPFYVEHLRWLLLLMVTQAVVCVRTRMIKPFKI